MVVAVKVGGRRAGRTTAQQQAMGQLDAPAGWPAQALRLPAWWYVSIEAGSGAEFPISGDDTTVSLAAPEWPAVLLQCRADG